MKVRQIDIARVAGVSRSTVAAVLSKKEGDPSYRIHPDTEKMVLKVARELDYSPSMVGRSLREQRTYLVGVLLSRVNFLYNGDVHTGIQEILDQSDFAPVVYAHTHDPENEWQCLESCMSRQVEGLIINAAVLDDATTNNRRLAAFRARHPIPVVEIFGRYIEGVPSVLFDYRKAAMLAVRKLRSLGHARIALLVHDKFEQRGADGQRAFHTHQAVWQGYQEAVEECGLSPLTILYPRPGDTTDRAGLYQNVSAHARRVFDHPDRPSAVVVHNTDMMLAILLRQQSGSRSPAGRVVCAGLGSMNPIAHSLDEAVCIDFPSEEVGRVAASLLVSWIESGHPPSDLDPVYVSPRSE